MKVASFRTRFIIHINLKFPLRESPEHFQAHEQNHPISKCDKHISKLRNRNLFHTIQEIPFP